MASLASARRGNPDSGLALRPEGAFDFLAIHAYDEFRPEKTHAR